MAAQNIDIHFTRNRTLEPVVDSSQAPGEQSEETTVEIVDPTGLGQEILTVNGLKGSLEITPKKEILTLEEDRYVKIGFKEGPSL